MRHGHLARDRAWPRPIPMRLLGMAVAQDRATGAPPEEGQGRACRCFKPTWQQRETECLLKLQADSADNDWEEYRGTAMRQGSSGPCVTDFSARAPSESAVKLYFLRLRPLNKERRPVRANRSMFKVSDVKSLVPEYYRLNMVVRLKLSLTLQGW